MGRYYFGDIDGKFWFGIQSSFAADRFGSLVCEEEDDYPSTRYSYFFELEHLADVEEELANIINRMGWDNFNLLQLFCSAPEHERPSFPDDTIRMHLSEYADYILGLKIRDCIASTGQCYFEVDP
jgi:hypothetical protein